MRCALNDIVNRQRLIVVLGRQEGSVMQLFNLLAIRTLRPAWNNGRIIEQKLPLNPKHVWATQVRLELFGKDSDFALFNFAIDSKLRGCDNCLMQYISVTASSQINERTSALQSNTQKPVFFEISKGTLVWIAKWMEDSLMVRSEYLRPGQFHERFHTSTRQYARSVRNWVPSIGIEMNNYCTS